MAGAPLRGQPFRTSQAFRSSQALRRARPFRRYRRYNPCDATNGENVDAQLQTLIDLQGLDGKIAGLESEAARLPRQIEALHTALAEAKKAVDTIKTKVDST